VSSRYSSTSTLCASVVELPVGNDDAPPPLPPRQPRRESHGASFDSPLSPPPPPLPPPLLPLDSTPPVIPPRNDHLPPPLPPRRPTVEYVSRRHNTLAVRVPAAASSDGVVPQLPPKTYRQSHVRQSSS